MYIEAVYSEGGSFHLSVGARKKPLRFDTILHYNKYKRLPRREKGTVDHDPSLILSRREVVSVMTWSEFLAFLMFVIELFKVFLRVLRFVVKLLKNEK